MRQSSSLTAGRLRSIDALRGAAALGVVLYHEIGSKSPAPTNGIWNWLITPVWLVSSFGYVGVFLFFVISGFCIHLRWARLRTIEENPTTDFVQFWKRRFTRLYPPYLIALLIYLLVSGFTTKFQATAFYVWDVTSHLLMLHNLDARTVYSINGVFWTLAIEEQLYLAYFLLLFLRTRFGWPRALLVCAAVRIAWLIFSLGARSFLGWNVPVTEAAASHWLTWALGALAVEAALGIVVLPKWCKDIRVGGAGLLLAIGLTYLLPEIESHPLIHESAWLILHPLWGGTFFVIINRFILAERAWKASTQVPALVRLFASVGVFSYSLYLTHQLVLMESYRFTRLGLSEDFVALVIMTPASIFFAWLFFAFCERPFIRSSESITRPAALSPDPMRPYFKVPPPPAPVLFGGNQVQTDQPGQIFAKMRQK